MKKYFDSSRNDNDGNNVFEQNEKQIRFFSSKFILYSQKYHIEPVANDYSPKMHSVKWRRRIVRSADGRLVLLSRGVT